MKRNIRNIHQWLGLFSGLLVFVIAITGAIYTFQEEILNLTESHRFVPIKNLPLLKPSQLETIAKAKLPGKTLHSIEYKERGCAAIAIFYHYEPTYYYKMYLDPYAGEVLHIQNMDAGFFQWILKGHMYLWLPPDIGRIVVLISTLIFTFMIMTGLFLWLPKRMKGVVQRMTFQWKETTKWKRKNWDLHAIVGFYGLIFSLIFAITGLVWVFPNFADFYYKVIGGQKSLQYTDAVSERETKDSRLINPMDSLFEQHKNTIFDYKSFEIHPPETDSSSVLLVTNPCSGTYWKSDYIFYNQYNLAELEVGHIWDRFAKAGVADKILRLNYDVHVGAALGLPGKIIAFIASLLIASLPITGFLIFYGKKIRKKAANKI